MMTRLIPSDSISSSRRPKRESPSTRLAMVRVCRHRLEAQWGTQVVLVSTFSGKVAGGEAQRQYHTLGFAHICSSVHFRSLDICTFAARHKTMCISMQRMPFDRMKSGVPYGMLERQKRHEQPLRITCIYVRDLI
mmetsp:Transcript_18323/g.30597  ORF Transcript_18323/g.30597 Transcript_18323/m.30597 type:complete len:135 (-) Transcript_18323:168-572(-)